MSPALGIVVFSAVETATVVVWAKILFYSIGVHFAVATELLATAVLLVGYLIEHVIAFNVSKGRGWFDWPRD